MTGPRSHGGGPWWKILNEGNAEKGTPMIVPATGIVFRLFFMYSTIALYPPTKAFFTARSLDDGIRVGLSCLL